LITTLENKGIRIERSTNDSDMLYKAPGLKSPGRLMEYSLGHIHSQALTSCLAAIALSPKKHAYVLDMCASPGGKTSHLAQLLQNSGLIVANELYPSRQIPLGHTLNRLGIVNTVITGYQAQQFPLNQKFDYILADVPCSAEGKFRKLNDDYVYKERNSKRQLPVLQKKIVLRGYDLLKVGGEMLYATCTYNPEENESVIDFLLKHRDVTLLPIELKTKHEPGIVQWRKKKYDRKLRLATRYYPHQTDSVGFFMARIVRKG
jgi:NOL1/NOP2/sun family putative RNA methylase